MHALRAASTQVLEQESTNRRSRSGPVPGRGDGPARALAHEQILYLQRTAGNWAVAHLLSGGTDSLPIQREDAKAPAKPAGSAGAAVTYDPGLNAELNMVSGGWTFLAQEQVLAIDDLYEDAKKTPKPSLQEELLIALAEAALAAALGGVGGLLAAAIERKIAKLIAEEALNAGTSQFRDAAGRFVTTEVAKKMAEEGAKTSAKFVAESAKDAMKEGVKLLAKPQIKAVLSEGKKPVDAFFQGQRHTIVAAGKKGFEAAERARVAVEKGHNPMVVAKGLHEAQDEVFNTAEATQKDESLKAWFTYAAQAERKTSKETEGTDLAPRTDPVFFDTPGVLYLTIRPDGGKAKIEKASIKGTTAHFVRLIEDKPIKDLGIPMIVTGHLIGGDDFTVRYNEKRVVFVPDHGGTGRQWLIEMGGGQYTASNSGWYYAGGEAELLKGGRVLVEERLGGQTLKGILEPDT